MEIKTYPELMAAVERGEYKLRSSSLSAGYVSRKIKDEDIVVEVYAGKYGQGFVTYTPNFASTRYCWKNYYLKADK